jgi:ribose-phosphate pyrophosphokinase
MILINNRPVQMFKFPAQEVHLAMKENYWTVKVEMKFEGSDDIMTLLLLDNILRKEHSQAYPLTIKYFPYARQDRHTEQGAPFSLRVMADIVKMCNISLLTVWDAHSDVLESLFPERFVDVIEQYQLLDCICVQHDLYRKHTIALVSPDAGSLKKIYKCAKKSKLPVIKADKNRNVSTGEIISTSVHNLEEAGDRTLLIVDDICDAGRTFIELAKAIKADPKYQGNEILLYVTHGIFSKGLDVFNDYIDKIYCPNVMNQSINLELFNLRKLAV